VPSTVPAPPLDEKTVAMLGQPVDLGQIGRALKKLWESTGGTQTRASLVNFAVYGEGVACLEANTELISNFTREHSCRAILIGHDHTAAGPKVQAWINAHCHLPRAGAKHVCCEQITFLIEGGSSQLLTNILFANLDSDLPLFLWWQGRLSEPLDEQLWSWVDRLIFDSRDWPDAKHQFTILQSSLAKVAARLILCDLNWTRTLHLRQAIAQMFDHPENLAQLPRIQRLQITHAPGYELTALLFAAWISAQLGWTPEGRQGKEISFTAANGNRVDCRLEEAPGAPVGRCELSTGDGSVVVQRDAGSSFYRAEVHLPDGRTYSHLLPAGSDEIGGLLDEEITLGGRHRVYMKALAAAQPLL
jgi:glucose-6-phosphate dehydrogenase assembly protein OpcA